MASCSVFLLFLLCLLALQPKRPQRAARTRRSTTSAGTPKIRRVLGRSTEDRVGGGAEVGATWTGSAVVRNAGGVRRGRAGARGRGWWRYPPGLPASAFGGGERRSGTFIAIHLLPHHHHHHPREKVPSSPTPGHPPAPSPASARPWLPLLALSLKRSEHLTQNLVRGSKHCEGRQEATASAFPEEDMAERSRMAQRRAAARV